MTAAYTRRFLPSPTESITSWPQIGTPHLVLDLRVGFWAMATPCGAVAVRAERPLRRSGRSARKQRTKFYIDRSLFEPDEPLVVRAPPKSFDVAWLYTAHREVHLTRTSYRVSVESSRPVLMGVCEFLCPNAPYELIEFAFENAQDRDAFEPPQHLLGREVTHEADYSLHGIACRQSHFQVPDSPAELSEPGAMTAPLVWEEPPDSDGTEELATDRDDESWVNGAWHYSGPRRGQLEEPSIFDQWWRLEDELERTILRHVGGALDGAPLPGHFYPEPPSKQPPPSRRGAQRDNGELDESDDDRSNEGRDDDPDDPRS